MRLLGRCVVCVHCQWGSNLLTFWFEPGTHTLRPCEVSYNKIYLIWLKFGTVDAYTIHRRCCKEEENQSDLDSINICSPQSHYHKSIFKKANEIVCLWDGIYFTANINDSTTRLKVQCSCARSQTSWKIALIPFRITMKTLLHIIKSTQTGIRAARIDKEITRVQ